MNYRFIPRYARAQGEPGTKSSKLPPPATVSKSESVAPPADAVIISRAALTRALLASRAAGQATMPEEDIWMTRAEFAEYLHTHRLYPRRPSVTTLRAWQARGLLVTRRAGGLRLIALHHSLRLLLGPTTI